MLNFNENALKYGAWSQSKLDVAQQCGLRFNLKYIQNKKEPFITRPEGRIGSAAHKAIELVLKGQTLERALRVAAVENKLLTNEIDELQIFEEPIVNFVERVKKFEATYPAKKKLVEHKFGLTRDLKPTEFFAKDVFFRGIYDFTMHLEKEDLIIIDHKSGQPSADISKYIPQLRFYAVAGRVLYPTVKGVRSGIYWIRSGELVWGDYVSAQEIDESYLSWFETQINNSVANLSDQPNKGWYCGFCGFQSQCPLFAGGK